MTWRKEILVLALYGALTLLMTMPLLANITTHVAGAGGDPWQTMWRFEDSVRVFSAERLFGGGEARLVNLSVWPWIGLHALFGQPLAYNIVWLLSFVLSGYFMFLLARYLTKHETASFLAGIFYMFLPFHVAHSLGHFGAMQMQWIPLAILLLFLFFKRPTIWRTLGLTLVLVMQSWTEHHYFLWLVIFAGLFYLIRPFGATSPSKGEVPLLTKERSAAYGGRARLPGVVQYYVLLVFLLFFFVVLPWVPTMKLAFQPGSGLELGKEQTIRFSADVFSFVAPPQWQPIWGGVFHELLGKHFTGNAAEATQFLGWVPLLLIIFFFKSVPRKQAVFWTTIAAVFALIALGPRLHVFGNVLPVPLPYDLLGGLPVFSSVRAVARAGVMVGAAVSILFAWILANKMAKRRWSALIVGAVILIEFLWLPIPLQSTELSRAYDLIAELPGKRLVEIPAATNYTVASRALYASLIHGKEVVGNIALERAEGDEELKRLRSTPGLRWLIFARPQSLLNAPEDFGQDVAGAVREGLAKLDVHVIAVHSEVMSGPDAFALTRWLENTMGLVPEAFDGVLVYRL